MGVFPWHHRWNVLAMTVLAQTIVVGIQYCFPFWVVPWAEEFQVPHSQLFLVVSASTLIVGFASPFAGAIFDRYPVHWLFSFGVVAFSLLYVLMSFATSHWVILLLYGLLLPATLVLTTNLFSQIMIARWFVESRGLAMGISALGVSFGAFVMPPIATALLAHYDWHATFRMLALSALVILIPTGLLVLTRKPDASSSPQTAVHGTTDASTLTTAALLRNRDFWLIAAGFGFMLLACLAAQFGVGSYAKDLGISQQQAALAASLSAVSFGCGKLGFGKLADLLPHRLSYWMAVTLVLLGIGIYSSAGSLLPFTLGLMLMTLGQGCFLPISSGMVIERFGVQSFGRVMGLLWMFIGLGSVSPFIAGLIRDATGSYSTAFIVMSLPLLLTAFAMRAMPASRAAEPA